MNKLLRKIVSMKVMGKRKRSIQKSENTLRKKKRGEYVESIESSLSRDIALKIEAFHKRRSEPSDVDISEWKAKRALSNWYLGYPKRALSDALDSMSEDYLSGKAESILQSIGCVVPKGLSIARATRSSTIASNILDSLLKTLSIFSDYPPRMGRNAINFMANYRNALRSFQQKEFLQGGVSLNVCYDLCNKKFGANNGILLLLDGTKEFYGKRSVSADVEPYSLVAVNDRNTEDSSEKLSQDKKPVFANNAEALLQRSMANFMLNELLLALSDADNFLLLEPDNVKGNFLRAIVFIELKDYHRAITVLNLCLKSLPEDLGLLNLVGVVEQEYRASMDRFPDDVLIKISEMLSLPERFSAELISRRWNRCMAMYGWRNLKVYKDLGTTRAKYVSLFKRCGNSLLELKIQQPFSFYCAPVWSLLSMLRNIQHLSLSANCYSTPDLKVVAESFPRLVSAEFILLSPSAQEGLTYLLSNCKELKYLKFRELKGFLDYGFAEFPLSLKCLDVDHTVNCSEVLNNAVKNGCRLESLKIFAWAAPYLYDNSFYFESLKYLCVYVQNAGLYLNFVGSLASLPNLRALDLWSGLDGRQTHVLLEAVVSNCQQLEHFSLNFHSSLPVVVRESSFDQICNLGRLTSVCIGGNFQNEDGGRPSLQNFFDKMASYGNLKYIKIKSLLPIQSVCNALKICKELSCLGWRIKNEAEDWQSLLITLNEIHTGCGPQHNGLILRIFCYCGHYRWPDNMPYHPWIKFCALAEPSAIREKYRVGCLPSRPTFARDH